MAAYREPPLSQQGRCPSCGPGGDEESDTRHRALSQAGDSESGLDTRCQKPAPICAPSALPRNPVMRVGGPLAALPPTPPCPPSLQTPQPQCRPPRLQVYTSITTCSELNSLCLHPVPPQHRPCGLGTPSGSGFPGPDRSLGLPDLPGPGAGLGSSPWRPAPSDQPGLPLP